MTRSPVARAGPGGNVASSRHALLFLVAWLPYAFLVRRFWFITDDAFISFRYAHNWAQGLGLRYNLGAEPPVEGYSNFLWVVLCALLERLGLPPVFWAPLISFACGTLLLWQVWGLLRSRCCGGEQQAWPVAWLALLSLAANPAFALWSTSGLETMPFALLFFVTFQLGLLRGGWRSMLLAGLAALGLALMRTEGIAWSLLLGVAALYVQQGRRRQVLLAWLLPILLVYGVYFVLRYQWFQQPFANTVVAKVGFSGGVLARGLRYLLVFNLTFLAPLAVLPGLWVGAVRHGRTGQVLATLFLAVWGYAVVVGGCHMPMGRFLVPSFALGALALGEGLRCIASRWGRRWASGLGLALVLVGCLPSADLHLVPENLRARFHFRWNLEEYASEYSIWALEVQTTDFLTQVAMALRQHTTPGESIVVGAIGAIGYYTGLEVYDRFGLVTPEVARRPVSDSELRSPGHDRRVDIWYFLKDEPTILFATLLVGDQLIRGVAPFARDLQDHGAADRYVPLLFPLEPVGSGSVARYLLMLRHIPPGVEPQAAWSASEAHIRALEVADQAENEAPDA